MSNLSAIIPFIWRELWYITVMRGLQNIFNIRLQMVKLALEKGIYETARQYNTTRNTVRKWVRR